MVDAEFGHPRLAGIYDALDPDRSDLLLYLGLAEELSARRVLDVGCGTGTLALMLADMGCDVVGLDPARASLEVARSKPRSERVSWVEGDGRNLPAGGYDLVTMTANVAQAIADPPAWSATLHSIRRSLAPGGTLVFETRDPAARAWEGWNREATQRTVTVTPDGDVTTWTEVIDVEWPLVSFRSTWRFAVDDAVLTSTSTLRFRTQDEVRADLHQTGFRVVDVRDAPDRPGLELVFVARRA